jgi:hypothetical protein
MKTKTQWIKWLLAIVTFLFIINGIVNAIQNL